ncbi:hypothetical protein ACFLY2_03380 [Patescibacteria group bacterium]
MIPHTFVPKLCIGSVIAFVISEVLIAAITAHHRTTIQKTLSINVQTTHKAFPHQSPIESKNHVTSLHSALHIFQFIANLNHPTFKTLSSILTLRHCIADVDSQFFINHSHTTYINNNQKLKANIVYTGTIARAINSFTLNFAKNHSPHQSFLSKKYINQNTGEIIVYIQI